MTYEQQIEKIREAIDDASQDSTIDASVVSLFRAAAAAAQALADDIYGEYLPAASNHIPCEPVVPRRGGAVHIFYYHKEPKPCLTITESSTLVLNAT